jgi:hypothetical protein
MNPMNFLISRKTGFRVLICGALAMAAALALPGLLPAQTDACALVKAGDAAALVGGTPVSKPSPQGGTCTWTGSIAGHKLNILTYKNTRVPGEMAFLGAQQGAQADHDVKVSNEGGLGDKAFSATTSFGAIFVVLKQGRLLQIQYMTGSRGTIQDVAALRPIVQKAVAAF